MRSSIAPLAANCLFGAGAGEAPLLVSIEAEPVLRIVDHAFGGKGEAPCPLPASFSMAADLMIGRIEGLLSAHITAAIAATAGAAPGAPAPSLTPLRRDGSLAMLAPFAEKAPLAMLTLEVEDGGVLPWLVTMAMPMGTLAALFGYPDPTPASGAARSTRRLASAGEAPFADIPLPLRAVLVDMRISFAAVAALEPGQILPVTVARRVPLRIDDHTIAHGSPGTMDEHIAIQITQAF